MSRAWMRSHCMSKLNLFASILVFHLPHTESINHIIKSSRENGCFFFLSRAKININCGRNALSQFLFWCSHSLGSPRSGFFCSFPVSRSLSPLIFFIIIFFRGISSLFCYSQRCFAIHLFRWFIHSTKHLLVYISVDNRTQTNFIHSIHLRLLQINDRPNSNSKPKRKCGANEKMTVANGILWMLPREKSEEKFGVCWQRKMKNKWYISSDQWSENQHRERERERIWPIHTTREYDRVYKCINGIN